MKQWKLLPLICGAWVVAWYPSWAIEKRFLEIPGAHDSTVTFDLDTVQIIQPGRFTVVSTEIDNPEVMQFRLNVLEHLRTHCAHAEGKYPAPPELFTLGRPDIAVADIEVAHVSGSKFARWFYPYLLLSPTLENYEILFCDGESNYFEMRTLIANGSRHKDVYDCRRGLYGMMHDENDPTSALLIVVPEGSYLFDYYVAVCRAVTHEEPYLPQKH